MSRERRAWWVSIAAGLLAGTLAGGVLLVVVFKLYPLSRPVPNTPTTLSPAQGPPLSPSLPQPEVTREWLEAELRQLLSARLQQGRRTAIVEATEQVCDAVVTLHVTEERSRRSLIDELLGTPGRIYQTEGIGSGVIASSDGYILTNDHVVGGAAGIRVRLPDNREFEGVVVDRDPGRDLAVIKIDPPSDLPVASFGAAEDVLVGEWVIAIGSPYGFMLKDAQPSVSVGVVSAVGRSFLLPSGGSVRFFPSTIQTDAAINPGNSGGPLVNTLGQVIGINSFILSESGGSVGLGFAIPIEYALEALDQVRTYGYMRRPWSGLTALTNEMRLVAQGVYNVLGAVVARPVPGGPADQAALREGDLIVRVNDEPIAGARDFEAIVVQSGIGDTLTVDYYPFRSSQLRTTKLVLGEEPRERR